MITLQPCLSLSGNGLSAEYNDYSSLMYNAHSRLGRARLREPLTFVVHVHERRSRKRYRARLPQPVDVHENIAFGLQKI